MTNRSRIIEKDSVRIGTCMRIAREERHLNQDTVAAEIGMHRNALSKAELGANDMTFSHFYRLVQVLDRDPADLMFGEPHQLPSGEEVILRSSGVGIERVGDAELQSDMRLLEERMQRFTHYQRTLLLKLAEDIDKVPVPGADNAGSGDDGQR